MPNRFTMLGIVKGCIVCPELRKRLVSANRRQREKQADTVARQWVEHKVSRHAEND